MSSKFPPGAYTKNVCFDENGALKLQEGCSEGTYVSPVVDVTKRRIAMSGEIDALVAEHIMGWAKRVIQVTEDYSTEIWEDKEGYTASVEFFNPSSCIAAAWEVVERMMQTPCADGDHYIFELSAMTGASSATQTFNILVTIVVTGTITDHGCLMSARLLNAAATGVTMAAA